MTAEPDDEFREFMRGRWPAMVRLGVLRLVYGQAAPSVSYLVMTLTDGRTIHAQAVVLGNEKAFALALTSGQTPKHWAAYNAAGRPLSSGNL